MARATFTKARAVDSTAGHAPSGNATVIAAELAIARCRWCNDDLEHCHDALVVHGLGEVHCMSPSCSTPAELHHLVVPCAELGCTCTAADDSTAFGVA